MAKSASKSLLIFLLAYYVLFWGSANGLEPERPHEQEHPASQDFSVLGTAGGDPPQLDTTQLPSEQYDTQATPSIDNNGASPSPQADEPQITAPAGARAQIKWKKIEHSGQCHAPLDEPSETAAGAPACEAANSEPTVQLEGTEVGDQTLQTEVGAAASGGTGMQDDAQLQLDPQILDPSQQPADQPAPEAPAPLATANSALGAVSKDQVHSMLKEAQQQLFNASQRRDVGAAVAKLLELSRIVQQVMPGPARRSTWGAAATGATAVAAAGATATSASPSSSDSLLAKSREYHGTGVDTAAHALYSLAALQLHRLVDEHLDGSSSAEAIVQLHQAAMAGSMEAMYSLTDRWMHGIGVQRNDTIAMQYARLAAQWLIEETEAARRFAPPLAPTDLREAWVDQRYVSAEENENADGLLALTEDMAMRGSVDAQRRLAYRRLLGRGIDADPEGAFRVFQAGAQQGDTYAIFNLGYMYMEGLFVPVNYTRARELFEQAAAKDMPAAWSGLGNMFWTGNGGQQNMTASFEAYLKGAALNNSDSMYNLGVLCLHGLGTEVNATRGFEWFEKADSVGHWKTAYILATLYEAGTGVEKNITKALHFYRKVFKEHGRWTEGISSAAKAFEAGDHWGALVLFILVAEQGSDTAAVNAAWMLRQGLGYHGPNSLDLAARLYERAAKQGNAAGAVELANMIFDAEELGLARPRNLSQVLFWYQQAAASNNTEGLYHLAWAHHRGIGTSRNVSHAALLYKQGIRLAGRATLQFQRMVAPALGLLAITLDQLLDPCFGPDATYRAALKLQGLLSLKQHRARAKQGGTEAAGEGGEGYQAQVEQLHAHQSTARTFAHTSLLFLQSLSGSLGSSALVDNILIVICLAALAAVLGLRHYQRLNRDSGIQR